MLTCNACVCAGWCRAMLCFCVQQAIGSIHLNPATALAPIPVTSLPVLYKSLRGSEQVTPAEQEEVSKTNMVKQRWTSSATVGPGYRQVLFAAFHLHDSDDVLTSFVPLCVLCVLWGHIPHSTCRCCASAVGVRSTAASSSSPTWHVQQTPPCLQAPQRSGRPQVRVCVCPGGRGVRRG